MKFKQYLKGRIKTLLLLSILFSFLLFINSFLSLIPSQKPILFVSRQIPCCGSVYMKTANALPGVGGFSKYQIAAPAYLCILNPDNSLDTLINGALPNSNAFKLIDISAPHISYDGQKIVFAGLPEGNYEYGNHNMTSKEHNAWRIFSIGIDGTGLQQLSFSETELNLTQFNPAAQGILKGFDDTDPIWLPDGRICFSSTRYRDIAMYNVVRTSNLFVMNSDGTELHRITTEKNGADRPVMDPITGKIVFSRWWRNFHWPFDSMLTTQHPVYKKGWLYKDGMTSHLDDVIDAQSYMFNNNSFFLSEINPDGTALKMFSAHYRELSSNSVYGGCFNLEGDFIGNWFPIEHVTESSGFGGIKKYYRGSAKRPTPLVGVTTYGNLDYYVKNPPSYGIFNGEFAAEPYVTEDGRILFSKTPDPFQDYGIWIMNGDGSGKQLIFDHPGTTELHAQFIESRKIPPVIKDQVLSKASALPPTGITNLWQDGNFIFDCRNIFFNAPVDKGIIAGPAVGNLASVRFFANPLLNEQYGSLEMLNFPILYNEISVDNFGRVLEKNAPANLALFEQARSSPSLTYKIPRTGGGIMDGAAHVTGFNYGSPGQIASCVGCHAGHSMISVPDDPSELLFSNLAPGAIITASSSMNEAGYVIDNKNYTAQKHWFTPEGVSPVGQWLKMKWLVPVYAKKIVLHNTPDTLKALVRECKLQLFEDSSFLKRIREIIIKNPISPSGTEIELIDIPLIQSMRFEFLNVSGGIYHWNAATLGEIEVIASLVHPVRFKEICDCNGKAYGPFKLDSCGQCLLPEDPRFNDCLTNVKNDTYHFSIFPNPTLDVLHVQFSSLDNDQLSIEIWATDGSQFFPDISINASNALIHTCDLNPGLYYIKFNMQSDQLVYPFLKL